MIELRRRHSGGKGSDSPSFSRLPAGYQEVEWLMNKDGAYIETNIIPPDGCCFELEASLPTSPNLVPPIYDYVVFGSDINFNYAGFSLSFSNTIANPPLGIAFHMESGILVKGGTNIFPTSNLFHKYKYENGNCWINDEMVLADNPCKGFGIPIDIFALRRGTNATHIIANVELKLKPLKLYTDNVDIAELIPCYRTSDRVAGMYDIVTDVFYVNQGTGEFLYGPDVHYNIPPEYQQVEYLESTGTQYIDTGYIANRGSAFIIDYSDVYRYSGDSVICGAGSANNTERFFMQMKTDRSITFGIGSNNATGFIIGFGRYKYTIDSHNSICKIFDYRTNIEQSFNITNTLESSFYSVLVFARNEGTIGFYHYAKCYKIELYDYGTLVRELIPCYRKSDNVAGMYDLVSGEFYTNAGTGEFIVGPDIIE